MKIGRIIRNANGFERVTLEEKEEQAVLEKVRERNLEVYRQCFGDAKGLVVKGPALLTAEDMKVVTEVATALFEKLAVGSLAALSSKLDEKVFYLKEYAKTLEAMEV